MFILSLTPTFSTWGWLVVALLLGIAEALSISIVSIWFAIGALLTIPLTFFHLHFGVELMFFAVASLILLFFTRPIALKYLKIGEEKTDISSLIGKEAYVLETNVLDSGVLDYGDLKVDGKVWRFKSESGHIYHINDCVQIIKIEGNTLWVL